jgi:hypothetical protein
MLSLGIELAFVRKFAGFAQQWASTPSLHRFPDNPHRTLHSDSPLF